jgi:hypothetical protein
VDGNTEFYIGMEDNVCNGRGFSGCSSAPVSDRDYNDLLVRVYTLPEPGSLALTAAGLLLVAGVSRRRSVRHAR